MKRTILVVVAALAAWVTAGPASAGGFRSEDASPAAIRNQAEDRWTGRWVITRTETRSDCRGVYTDNVARGRALESRGRERFGTGTPARVDSIDVTRSRISLRLTLSEVLLVTRTYREVTLREEARCQVELKVLVAPGLFESGDVAGLESLLDPFVDLHASEESALLASNFLPVEGPEYAAARQQAMEAHQEWKAERASRAYEARLNQWASQTAGLAGQISSDPDYLDGFARGVEAGRSAPVRACADLARFGPALHAGGAAIHPGGLAAAHAAKGRRQKNWARGYQDGMRLVLGLQAMEMMRQCAPPAATPARPGPDAPAAVRAPARPAAAVPASSTAGQ